MTGNTHIICGTAVMTVLVVNHTRGFCISGIEVMPLISLITVTLGSYLPDIDVRHSHLGKRHWFLSRLLKHRGITHTFLIPILLLTTMIATKHTKIIPSIIFGLLIGWVSHIMADLFNAKGVPFFWPFLKKRVHLAKIRTGSWMEAIFLMVWLALCFYFM